MRTSAVFAAFASLAGLAAASLPHSPSDFSEGYHGHTAFARNGTALRKRATAAASCPKTNIIAEYVPAWSPGAAAGIEWEAVDLAFWFCTLTSSDGIELAPGMTIGGMQDFVQRANSAGKKPLLTIGGWSGSVYFSSLVSTASSRTGFANTLSSWIDQYGFAGVDIDWEFVGRQGAGNNQVSSADASNYLLFLEKLRSVLGSSKLITAAFPAAGINGADGAIMKDVSAFAQWFDYIELMAYDFMGSWSATTGPNAALYTCNSGSDSVDATIDRWIAAGFPACRLLLGIPSYSHNFQTTSSSLATTTYNGQKTTAFQQFSSVPSDDGLSIKGLVSAGYLSSDLTKGAGGFTRYFDSCTQTPFLFNPTTKVFYAYDDEVSWQAKASLAKTKGLAGVAIYESTGHTTGMLNAVASAIGHSYAGSSPSTSATPSSTTSASPSTTSSSSAPTAVVTCSVSNDCAGNAIPVNSNPYCAKGQCTFRCRSGFTQSGSTCTKPGVTTTPAPTTSAAPTTRTTTSAAPAATQTCSVSNDCAAYDRPAHSNAYCKSKVCTFRCQSGYSLDASGTSCVQPASSPSTSTTTSAAPATQTCNATADCSNTPPQNANRYCNKGVCSFRCKSGYALSGTSTCSKTAARRFARAKRAHSVVEDLDGLFEDADVADLDLDALLD
ncbi:hypothetical protein JCM10213_006905 [Rhodosporidiobolus nylandii]